MKLDELIKELYPKDEIDILELKKEFESNEYH